MKYPRIYGHRRKPKKDMDGSKNHGKPCINCGTSTIGEKWVQWSIFRGEDEVVRVCNGCWGLKNSDILFKLCAKGF